jgi:ankyrin repeat protein
MLSEPSTHWTADEPPDPPTLPCAERIQELLFDAARLGRVDVIPALLQAGGDIGAADPKGHTPLILASYHGHQAATALLLERGAAVDQPDATRGNSALMGAAFKGYDAIAELLLAAGADPQLRNRAGQTALMMAALFDRAAMVDRLLGLGADPEACDGAGNSAISVAHSQGNKAMVAKLAAGRVSSGMEKGDRLGQ